MKKLTLLLAFVFALCGLKAQQGVNLTAQAFEPNTVFIKHPAAANVDAYFSEADLIGFEVYKPANKVEFHRALEVLRGDAAVESCTEGKVTGDYYAVTISLKSRQSKAWFVKWMKSAGFSLIKINNNEPVALDKL